MLLKRIIFAFIFTLLICGCDDQKRNAYMLDPNSGADFGILENPLCNRGYDWWWHNFTAHHAVTGEEKTFFIEYFVINPCLGGDTPILGQRPENQEAGIKPSYGMIKAGTWGKDAAEINNFYPISAVSASIDEMAVQIGPNMATEYQLSGSVGLSEREAAAHPEYMSDAGSMSWNLSVDKVISYSVGYGTSEILRDLNAFNMFWHVQGLSTKYAGTVVWNGEPYLVEPETSYGYADKNWGRDYTNPWIWLSSTNFVDANTGEALPDTALDVGGGLPKLADMPLWKTAIIAFFHQGQLYEFNFSKLWKMNDVRFNVDTSGQHIVWDILATNSEHKIEIRFSNPKSMMLLFDYENPDGKRNHTSLWNGGHAQGTVTLYKKQGSGQWEEIGSFYGRNGGCEYGEYR